MRNLMKFVKNASNSQINSLEQTSFFCVYIRN